MLWYICLWNIGCWWETLVLARGWKSAWWNTLFKVYKLKWRGWTHSHNPWLLLVVDTRMNKVIIILKKSFILPRICTLLLHWFNSVIWLGICFQFYIFKPKWSFSCLICVAALKKPHSWQEGFHYTIKCRKPKIFSINVCRKTCRDSFISSFHLLSYLAWKALKNTDTHCVWHIFLTRWCE